MATKYIFTKQNLEFFCIKFETLEKKKKLADQKGLTRIKDRYLKFSELYKKAQQNDILMTRGSFAWFIHRIFKIITIQSNAGPWIIGTENNRGIIHMKLYMKSMNEYDIALWDGKHLSILPFSQYSYPWAKRWKDGYGQPPPNELAKIPFP